MNSTEADVEDIEQEDNFSYTSDELFLSKKEALNDNLIELGIFNREIRVWYYDEFNPSLIPNEGICNPNDNITRSIYDIWQIGILFIDLLTNRLIYDINKFNIEKDNKIESKKIYIDIAHHFEPISQITDYYDEYLSEGNTEFEERINKNKDILKNFS